MAPREVVKTSEISVSGVLNENDVETIDGGLKAQPQGYARRRSLKLVWRNIILFIYLHIAALYGLWLMLTSAKWTTGIFGETRNRFGVNKFFDKQFKFAAMVLYQMSGLGITAGAHRLWAHRSYKAKWPLRLILAMFNTLAFQDCAIHWARDHRVHHKYR
jgi:stearoyl-CoA desaturase (delta-9 desaturase)